LSHCVNYTVRDIVNNWPKDETPKIVILKDCASSVPGFEDAGELFLSEMEKAGVKVGTSDAVFREE
jgi:nicotinamidase/pyrazinamidase